VRCFALGIANEHQKQPRKNGTLVPNWKAILEVINAVYLQEFDDFKKIYPNGLSNPGKLRSEFSDRERGRHNKWRLRPDQCTSEELQAMNHIANVVIATEQRLSQLPGSIVSDPGVNPARWVYYIVKAPKAPNTGGASKKRKRQADSSEEGDDSEEEGSDDGGEVEGSSNGQNSASEESSRASRGPSQEQEGASSDSDEDDIVVTRRSLALDDDGDANRASDEDVTPATRMALRRSRLSAYQAPPSKKVRFQPPLQEQDQNYAIAGGFYDESEPTFGTGQFFEDDYNPEIYGLSHSNPVDHEDSEVLDCSHAEHEPLLHLNHLSSNIDTLGRQAGPSFKDVIDERGTQGASEGQDNEYSLAPGQAKNLRHHKQSDLSAFHWDKRSTVDRPPVDQDPPLRQLRDRIFKPKRAYYGDGHTENQSDLVYTYEGCKRTLHDGYQARASGWNSPVIKQASA
jgi:hypothetical protein